MLKFLAKLFEKRPQRGKDAQYIAYCHHCDDYELHASRGGFRNGGITHCYYCGFEKETQGFRQDDIDGMIISSSVHWRKFPKIPYHWHKFTEQQKQEVLNGNCKN